MITKTFAENGLQQNYFREPYKKRPLTSLNTQFLIYDWRSGSNTHHSTTYFPIKGYQTSDWPKYNLVKPIYERKKHRFPHR